MNNEMWREIHHEKGGRGRGRGRGGNENGVENTGPTETIRLPTADRNDKSNEDKNTNGHTQDRTAVSMASPPDPQSLLPQGIKEATFSVPR